MQYINVIGAGLAGCEAAWQIAQRGISVRLYEMRPSKMTPAHKTGLFAELVCSNSLRANSIENAVGLLKEEMRILDSLIMNAADLNKVPAGGALAVDRNNFSESITESIKKHPLIEVLDDEVVSIPDGITVLATGPLTSKSLSEKLISITNEEYFYFYDAAAPIVDGDSIDYNKVFWASRYGKGSADYLNCPMNKDEYENFYDALITAEVHQMHDFEKEIYFEGCMPVEVMAKRGAKTLLFGPLKPVGLNVPGSTELPYAVVQLRKDNIAGTLFNMVGFQTHLKWGEQQRVFRLIPGLEKADFVRYGVMHKNTFINSPKLLDSTTLLKKNKNIFIGGQLSGVEGYVESAASGLIAGINASRLFLGKDLLSAPRESAIGSLLYYISHADSESFQPMNITFGLIPPLKDKIRDKKKKKNMMVERALDAVKEWKHLINE